MKPRREICGVLLCQILFGAILAFRAMLRRWGSFAGPNYDTDCGLPLNARTASPEMIWTQAPLEGRALGPIQRKGCGMTLKFNAKLAIAALALLAPQIAFADCAAKHKPTASACASGEVWDAALMQCKAKPSS